MQATAARLKRLVSSGVCQARSAAAAAEELRRLGRKVRDEAAIPGKERLYRALGDATRLRIVGLLSEREMCVCEVMVALDMAQPTASHHLGILERAGIVTRRREGKWVLYRLSSPKMASFLRSD